MRTICGLFAVVVFYLAQGIAQTPRYVVLHPGHVLDVKSGRMLDDQMLVIEDGKIISASAKIPADALRIDLPKATVLPGLMAPTRI